MCNSEEWTRGGGYGSEHPAGYEGSQSCWVIYQDNTVCFGYEWRYNNIGGDVEGDRDSYKCEGIALL